MARITNMFNKMAPPDPGPAPGPPAGHRGAGARNTAWDPFSARAGDQGKALETRGVLHYLSYCVPMRLERYAMQVQFPNVRTCDFDLLLNGLHSSHQHKLKYGRDYRYPRCNLHHQIKTNVRQRRTMWYTHMNAGVTGLCTVDHRSAQTDLI